ncbi:HNH endonuclease [Halobellus limi]|uniref:HNH endonuclease n=1 Tax=Halobellus limi TaxID=699433 RepID=A0A1H5SZ60_9EURY|nr:HNH endonuclease [Halobellus limi]QCC47448.1 hypothetical protein DV707_07105 [Halobellus limi]SEF55826.1 HNH endonuclease [Halobellus limi]
MSSDPDAPDSDLVRSAEKAVDQDEALRRARQSARTLRAWSEVAGEDPTDVLEEIGSDPEVATDGGMRSFTVGPRVEFSLDHYPRIRVSEGGREWYVYLHRLTAFAHGELDALDDERHVHHVDGDRWNNAPENLEAVASHEHDELHEHTVIADGGIEMDVANVDVEAFAEDKTISEDGLRMEIDLYRRVQLAVNEDDVDPREVQAAVESLADDLQDVADVPDEWILEGRFGLQQCDLEDPGLTDRIVGWFR